MRYTCSRQATFTLFFLTLCMLLTLGRATAVMAASAEQIDVPNNVLGRTGVFGRTTSPSSPYRILLQSIAQLTAFHQIDFTLPF